MCSPVPENIPPDYYYRTINKEAGTWTGWQKIEGAIKGEHPVLQMYNGRLHIFWIEILEKPQEVILQHDTPPRNKFNMITNTYVQGTKSNPNNTTIKHTPPSYREIKLSWMLLYDTGWSPPTLSKDKLIHPWPHPDYALHLRPRQKGQDMWLDIYVSTAIELNGRYFYNQFENQYQTLKDQDINGDIVSPAF